MVKRVISIRLADEQLRLLDAACIRFQMNRSEAIGAAIRILDRYYSEAGKLIERYDFDLEPLASAPNDKD
jgi:hypothetical protein